jgi:hypothetical protein
VYLAINARVAHAAGNELGDLGTVIEDEDTLMHGFERKGIQGVNVPYRAGSRWRIRTTDVTVTVLA